MSKEDLLRLPICVGNWVILMAHLERDWDIEILYKIISDYFNELPLFEVERIIISLQKRVSDDTFQRTLEFIFSKCT